MSVATVSHGVSVIFERKTVTDRSKQAIINVFLSNFFEFTNTEEIQYRNEHLSHETQLSYIYIRPGAEE